MFWKVTCGVLVVVVVVLAVVVSDTVVVLSNEKETCYHLTRVSLCVR